MDLHSALELHRKGELAEAKKAYEFILEKNPKDADAWHLLGMLAYQVRQYEPARGLIQKALELDRSPLYLKNLGAVLMALKEFPEAEKIYLEAGAFNGFDANLHSSLAALYQQTNRHKEASESLLKSLELDPKNASAACNLGLLKFHLGLSEEALHWTKQSLLNKPDFFEAWNNLGLIQEARFEYKEAEQSFLQAIQYQPEFVSALYNLANLYLQGGEKLLARDLFLKIDHLDPDFREASNQLLHLSQHFCDFDRVDLLWQRHENWMKKDQYRGIAPFTLLSLTTDTHQQMLSARALAQEFHRDEPEFIKIRRDKIRLCYLSHDFREHPVGEAMSHILGHQDHSRFEIILASTSFENPPSLIQQSLRQNADSWLDLKFCSDDVMATRLKSLDLDLIVDLSGYTKGSRSRVLARKVAPAQVSFLGFCATSGAQWMDYFIADRFTAPDPSAFQEKLVYLDPCFMCYARSDKMPKSNRTEEGLPENALVLMALHSYVKISRPMLQIWCRLLHKNPGAVLWLPEPSDLVRTNLSKEIHGLEKQIIFAPLRKDKWAHLKRIGLADLCLDTYPYNAHYTGLETLASGVPVLTLCGAGMASRVGASFLNTLDLPSLITSSMEEYEAKADQLIRFPSVLKGYREKLKGPSPLFQPKEYVRKLEALFEGIVRTSDGRP